MKKLFCAVVSLWLVCTSALAMGDSEIRDIILEAYPGAKISKIERGTYKGQEVFDVDYRHGGENLEAFLTLEGDFIKVAINSRER